MPKPSKSKELTGAYYWLPRPHSNGPTWDMLTCHDLGVWDGISHRELWPHIVEHMAAVWGLEAGPLQRRLVDHHTGLPRGRITHPRSGYILLHGGDAPVEDWLTWIIDRFHLDEVEIELVDNEHESMDRRDLAAVQEALGTSLGFHRPVW